jgi:NAD(P)-dependent dehydrogenase (short-subunit alcohol dehydrogenase family)
VTDQAATPASSDDRPLAGRVCLVAGATRGAGRGIAVALGAAGATVYATGRSTRAQRSEYDRTESIEETAELVRAAGGTGIWAQVDHLEPDQVRARWNGQSVSSGQLARDYGFTDTDGSRPDAWRYLVEVQDAGKPPDVTGYR